MPGAPPSTIEADSSTHEASSAITARRGFRAPLARRPGLGPGLPPRHGPANGLGLAGAVASEWPARWHPCPGSCIGGTLWLVRETTAPPDVGGELRCAWCREPIAITRPRDRLRRYCCDDHQRRSRSSRDVPRLRAVRIARPPRAIAPRQPRAGPAPRPACCDWCGDDLAPASGPGRPRRFCSDGCRRDDYEDRHPMRGRGKSSHQGGPPSAARVLGSSHHPGGPPCASSPATSPKTPAAPMAASASPTR